MVTWSSLTCARAPRLSAEPLTPCHARFDRSGGNRQQPAQPDDVVGGSGEGEDPGDERPAAMAQLPQPADRFHPPEALLHQLAFLLTDRVPGVARRATVDRAAPMGAHG